MERFNQPVRIYMLLELYWLRVLSDKEVFDESF
ncbi:Uncharacterised protein [Rodentibacter pneumotropicus]|uniref:Uncharacterized protein n=1 Tax=Rodentibacter pneumotropicus TaxID=758 RepID=A0A448MQ55_9PAST|nr:Uncharacterised protein [Rodentibacter pneumotropicus]